MYNFLIIDDSKLSRMVLRNIIIELGHNILAEAQDGMEAIELMKSITPDVIITDYEMPNLNGLQTIEKIREFNKESKVIIITSQLKIKNRPEIQLLKISNVLIKPLEIDKLQNVLNIFDKT